MRAPLSAYPGMNRFVLDWLGGDGRFLPRGPLPEAARDRNVSPALVEALTATNARWGIDAADRLRDWGRGGTVTIAAGQQVGFAGGPLYTLAKIATIVRVKRDLEARGIAATAFFWLATEDHDYAEVARLDVPVRSVPATAEVNRQRDLVCMRAVSPADPRAVVGPLPVPDALITQLLSLYSLPRPSWLRAGITFRDSFAELVAQLFPRDLVLVDALEPALRREGASLFARIHAHADEIQQALGARAEALQGAGYREQVIARDDSDYTLLFGLSANGVRHPYTGSEPAESTSTSALTRPLLQDEVLQPDIFVGGPAEVAYYAQIQPLYDIVGVTMPRVALRGHALVAPHRVARAMARHGLTPAEVFQSADALLVQREPEAAARIQELLAAGEQSLLATIGEIGELALPADRTLTRSINRSVGHLEYHFRKLGERATRAVARKDAERYEAVSEIVATLYPDRHVQDRIVGWYPLWCTHGAALLEQLVAEIEPDSDHFRIVAV